MKTLLAVFAFALLICASPTFAQTNAAAVAVTGASTGQQVRFVSPSSVVRTRVEILSVSGEALFDVTSKGNVFDWTLQGGDGQRVADGDYICVVTVKTLSGKISQRIGTVSLASGKAVLIARADLSTAQQASIGPVEENALITVLDRSDTPSATVVAHDGKDGQVTSTSGALTFRTGDVFSGTETERMRITADGKIGIGTDHPETELDVRGTLRASDGYGFMNGSKLTVDDKGTLKVTRADGTQSPTVAGTGTQNRVAKWLETGGAGTLGDSTITDTGTNVGIGITTPQYPLHIVSPTFGQLYVSGGSAADFLMFHTGAPVNTRWTGLRSQNGFGKISSFNDIGTYRMENILTWNNANGFVGVGVQQPQYPIHIDNPTFGQLYVSGGTAADFLMYHTNGPVNAKWTGLRSQGGLGKISSFNDNGTYRNESILVWDNASGNVGIGTNAPTAKLDVAGIVNTSTQYDLGRLRIIGIGTGAAANNTYVGLGAGQNNTTGSNNTFVGFNSGRATTDSGGNTFVGNSTGPGNMSNFNTFVGDTAGFSNILGNDNAFFGRAAGQMADASQNSFFGSSAGRNTNTGGFNTFLGAVSGANNTAGSENIIVGDFAGLSATIENANTLIGTAADIAPGVTNSSAFGYHSYVTQSNSVVLGSISMVNGSGIDTNVGIGITAPAFKLHVVDPSNKGLRVQTNTTGGTVASFGSKGEFQIDAAAGAGGRFNIKEDGRVGIGTSLPNFRLHLKVDGQDGIKLQHTGTGQTPQIRWTDQSDALKASIGVGPTGTEALRLSVNNADRMVIEGTGLIRVPGGIYIANPNTLFITSPNGACWGITVNNSGALATFPLTCP